MKRSGISLASALVLLNSCLPYGFAGGGLPSHIKSVAVLPFTNETAVAELQRELYDRMKGEVEDRLGLRAASEARAHAVVRGRVTRYEADIPVGYSADPERANTARRRLQITVDVEIIDQSTGKPLWSQRGLSADSEYSERAEEEGREEAVRKLVDDVIAGAQSQW